MTADTAGDLAFASIGGLGVALAQGRITATQIIREALDRVAAQDSALGAFVRVFPEAALDAAAASDERRRTGDVLGPLDGIPFGVKDLFAMAGDKTAAGSKALVGRPEETVTATAVRRLQAAGMIPLGKVQTVEFAFGSWGTNPVCGTPLNPRDRAVPRAPGGSSSGSGVVVAAGLVPAALGTDTGGSVRNPSSMCGVIGLKTTVGLVGRGGLLPLAPTFDSIGPLARSVEDAALLLAALQGYDPDDPATFGVVPRSPLDGLGDGVAGLRLRVPAAADLAAVEPGVRQRFRDALGDFERLGATIDEARMPRKPETYMAHTGDIIAAEAWFHLGNYAASEDSVVHPAVRARIIKGRDIDAAGYQALMMERRACQVEFERYLDGADAFLTPTAPIVAPPLAGIDESKTPLGTFTRFVNLLDLAALSVPAGSVDGLPAALQIVVRRYADPLALRIGRALEIARGGLFEAPSMEAANLRAPAQGRS